MNEAMVFSSIEFLFLFLPAVIAGYYLLPRPARNGWLLASSLAFYAWGEPKFVIVMLASIAFNYFAALGISAAGKRRLTGWSRGLLLASVFGNLCLLGGYKYLNFVTATLRDWFPALHGAVPQTSILLPIGISFFTFQEMSYVIDVFRGEPVQRNPFRLALYVALFPQLIAGPIVRYSEIREQLVSRRETLKEFSDGCFRFLVGLNKKVLLANAIAPVSDALIASPSPGPGLAWLGMLAFSLQMYFDFGGYSDMAVGLGGMFGFRLPENFRYPYVSATIADFWRRWHISLSTWFRDYVYYPLGGSRVGRGRLVFNILVVWTLVGVWHGADWAFVAWGFAWGALLAVEKLLGIEKRLGGLAFLRLPYRAFTLFAVLTLAVFVRADGLRGALLILGALWGGTAGEPALAGYLLRCHSVVLTAAVIASTPLPARLTARCVRRVSPLVARFGAWTVQSGLAVLSVATLVTDGYNPFLYFNF